MARHKKAAAAKGRRAPAATSSMITHIITENINHNMRANRSAAGPFLSMVDEARNTQRHHAWNSELLLQRPRINFVSAGFSIPCEELAPAHPKSTVTQESPCPRCLDSRVNEGPRSSSEAENDGQSAIRITTARYDFDSCMDGTRKEHDCFVVDASGTGSFVGTGFDYPVVHRSPSVSSNSSDEIVLFAGRNPPKKIYDPVGSGVRISTINPSGVTPVMPLAAGSDVDTLTATRKASNGINSPFENNATTPVCISDKSVCHLSTTTTRTNGLLQSSRDGTLLYDSTFDEGDILADYIAHMVDDDSDEVTKSKQPQSVHGGFESVSKSAGDHGDMPLLYDGSNFDYSGVVENTSARQHQLSSVVASSGNKECSSKKGCINMEGQLELQQTKQIDTTVPVTDQLLSHGKINDKEISCNVCEDDFEENLGDSDDSALLRDMMTIEGSNRALFSNLSLHDQLGEDIYVDFDVMDRDRPSIAIKRKGKHSHKILNLSDSDLGAHMTTTWENDRLKKKARKQQKEALRVQSNISTRGDLNMSTKQLEAMAMAKIQKDIKYFLISSQQSLELMPMSKKNRKFIHEIGSRLGLNTKSHGKGDFRFPRLNKTARTRSFDDELFTEIEERITRKFFPLSSHVDKARPKDKKNSARQRSGNPFAATSYMDGEVVGATAPELGIDNRGRAMLEKMGWSTGTALGAQHNKGMLQPITHVVKNTRTGLG